MDNKEKAKALREWADDLDSEALPAESLGATGAGNLRVVTLGSDKYLDGCDAFAQAVRPATVEDIATYAHRSEGREFLKAGLEHLAQHIAEEHA